MTWNVVHNFPTEKDTYQVPIDYPTVGYDTIIASWFTDIFTSIFAMQDSLLDLLENALLKTGGTMAGNLIISMVGEDGYKIKFSLFETAETSDIWVGSTSLRIDLAPETRFFLTDKTHGNLMTASFEIFEFEAPVDFLYDIEVSDKTKGLILRSPNNSRFRLEVSDVGVLSTEAL